MPAINYCPHITEEKRLSYWMNAAEQAAGSAKAPLPTSGSSVCILNGELHLLLRNNGDVPVSPGSQEMP